MSNKKVFASDAVTYKGYVYFMSTEINAIYRYCIKERSVEYWNSLPEEPIYKANICCKIDLFNDKLIFSPMRGEKIWVYSFVDDDWKDYIFPRLDNCNEKAKFFQTHIYKNRFYIVGTQYPAIVCIDFDKDSVILNEEPYKPFYGLFSEMGDCYFRRDGVLIENKLYLASCISNSVVIVNLDNNETKVVRVGNENNRYSGVAYEDGRFILSPRRNTAFVIWDGYNTEYEIPLPDTINEDAFTFLGVNRQGDSYFFPAMHISESVILDSKNMSIRTVNTGRMLFYRNDNEYVLSQTACGNFEFAFDNKESFEVEMLRVKNIEALSFKRFDKIVCARESKSIDLELYINNLLH